MSNSTYYLLWLAAGLVIVAVISALISRNLRLRVMRRLKATEMLDALARYSEWVAAQRGTLLFHGQVRDDSGALREVRTIAQQWFPELSAYALQVFAAHQSLLDFLSAQQVLRQQDPEAWLESDHDAGFLEQWRQHLLAVHLIADKLMLVSGAAGAAHQPGTASPA